VRAWSRRIVPSGPAAPVDHLMYVTVAGTPRDPRRRLGRYALLFGDDASESGRGSLRRGFVFQHLPAGGEGWTKSTCPPRPPTGARPLRSVCLPAKIVRLDRNNISIPGKAVTSPRVSGGSGIPAPHRWRTSSPLAPASPCDLPTSGPSGEDAAAAALLRGPVGGRGTGVLLCLGMTRKLTCIPS
jgi:hypothetical protein